MKTYKNNFQVTKMYQTYDRPPRPPGAHFIVTNDPPRSRMLGYKRLIVNM